MCIVFYVSLRKLYGSPGLISGSNTQYKDPRSVSRLRYSTSSRWLDRTVSRFSSQAADVVHRAGKRLSGQRHLLPSLLAQAPIHTVEKISFCFCTLTSTCVAQT